MRSVIKRGKDKKEKQIRKYMGLIVRGDKEGRLITPGKRSGHEATKGGARKRERKTAMGGRR